MRDRLATHQRILDAAYTLFYRNGFARVNVDEIAQAANVTKRTLYDHFRSKDELLAEVLQRQNALALQKIEKWDMLLCPLSPKCWTACSAISRSGLPRRDGKDPDSRAL
jgi:AcrR family transcriptional regulator